MRRKALLLSVLAIALGAGPMRVLPYDPRDPREPPPPSPWTREHVQVIHVPDGMPKVEQIDGRTCVATTGEPDSRLLYFAADNTWVFDVDETIEIEVEYDTAASPIIRLEYDSNHAGEKGGGAYHTLEADAGDTGERWVRHTFVLERARLTDRQNEGADFRLTGPQGIVRVADLKITRPMEASLGARSGRLKLTVLDPSTGKPTPARMGLYNAKGQFQSPNDKAVPIRINCRTTYAYAPRFEWTWPVRNGYMLYTYGQYECTLPAGEYELVVKRGIEYRLVHEKIAIEAGRTLEHVVTLRRWEDMPAKGWYSGDTHIHIWRSPEQNADIMAQIQAEDVHVANLLQVGDIRGCSLPQYAAGEKGRYRDGNYVLAGGQEDPRTDHRGHTVFLNLESLFHDDETYFLYHKAFQEARRRGGLVGYAHFGIAHFADRGMALDMPFHLVDFLEVLQRAKCDPSIWYEFLNLGFKLLPSAGSDFPYVDAIGAVRSYVHISGPFTAQAWFTGFARGHTFVTNGPMLMLTVNGAPMGSELALHAGEALSIEAAATINPDFDVLDRIELIVHGRPVTQVTATNAGEPLRLSHVLKPERSLWLAVRVQGKEKAVAHSAPVYVIVDGRPFGDSASAPELIARQHERLRDLLDKPVRTFYEPFTLELQQKRWAEQKPLVEQRVRAAEDLYTTLLKTLSQE